MLVTRTHHLWMQLVRHGCNVVGLTTRNVDWRSPFHNRKPAMQKTAHRTTTKQPRDEPERERERWKPVTHHIARRRSSVWRWQAQSKPRPPKTSKMKTWMRQNNTCSEWCKAQQPMHTQFAALVSPPRAIGCLQGTNTLQSSGSRKGCVCRRSIRSVNQPDT